MQLPTEREYTSFRIKNPELWKKVKIAAIENDSGVSEFVEKALGEYMATVGSTSYPMVQKATLILNRFQNLELTMSREAIDVGRGLKKDFISISDIMSKALTGFENALSLEKKPSTEHVIIEAARSLLASFNAGLTTGQIVEGPGLISKVEQLMKANERLIRDNERLIKENEQLRASLQNVSAVYEESSAKSR